jgi:hypothetical protein
MDIALGMNVAIYLLNKEKWNLVRIAGERMRRKS